MGSATNRIPEVKPLGTPTHTITAIVGNRIGPDCLATTLESAPNSDFVIGITPRADRDEIKRVIAKFPEISVRVGNANDILQSLSAGERVTDWLLNLWGELIVSQSSLDNCVSSLNIHPSLLPYGRGSDPIVWTIVNGWPAGATLHVMNADVDAGPIWAQREVPYDLATSGGELYQRVLKECRAIFVDEWPSILAGSITPRPQLSDEAPARRSQMLVGRDLLLDDPRNTHVTESLRWIQAYDFGSEFAGRVLQGGHWFQVRLFVTREEDRVADESHAQKNV